MSNVYIASRLNISDRWCVFMWNVGSAVSVVNSVETINYSNVT